MVRHHF